MSDAAPVEAELHGDVKLFFVGAFPSPWLQPPEIPPELEPFLPPGFDAEELLRAAGLAADPTGQGIADGRLKLSFAGEAWRVDVHHAVSMLNLSTGASPTGSSSGVARTAPELVDLTWEADTDPSLLVRGRTDRLVASFEVPHLTVALGRQPVSFGTGLVFTPMDVVNPFSAATIDTEYKPGIDAVRLDVFGGVSAHATAVVAWAGALPVHDPDLELGADDLIAAVSGGATIGTTDLYGLLSLARGEPVVGLGTTGSVGPLGVHAEGTLTVPSEDADEDDPFVRVVVGADGRPTATTTISGEAYYQQLGASDPSGYLEVIGGQRFARSEIWQAGQWYAALMVAQEITPLVAGNVALIANLADPSALVAPGLSWSVADEAVVAAGLYAGLGARPDPVALTLDPATFAVLPPTERELARSVNSEFGLYPVAVFVQARTYF